MRGDTRILVRVLGGRNVIRRVMASLVLRAQGGMMVVRNGPTTRRDMNAVKIRTLHKHRTINIMHQTHLRATVRLHRIRGTARGLSDCWMLRVMSIDDRGRAK
jgi:hypothetical protein